MGSTHHHVALVLHRVALHQRHIVVALVVSTLVHLALQAGYALGHCRHVGKRLLRLVAHRGVVLQLHHLRQVAYTGVVGHAHRARRGLLLSAEHLQHRRLPGSILAHKGDAVAGVDDKAGIRKQRLHAEFYL